MENGEAKSVRRSRDACASWIVYRRTRTCKLVRIGFWKGISRISPPSPPTHAPPPRMCIRDADAKFFPRNLRGPASNKLAILLASSAFAFAPLPPTRPPSPRSGTRGKALLMRSLIRPIEGCFADRWDVYPSRSATTRCALVSSTRCKKDLSSLLTDHCLSPII